MPPAPVSESRRPGFSWAGRVVGVLGSFALLLSALELSAYGLARFLTSDFLTPFFFCADLLSRRYPISGWTLSASPYFVPDHLLLGTLLASGDPSGMAYACYVPVFYTGLFILAGGCVKSVVGRSGPAFLAGLVFGNVFLALRFLPVHARCLWWLGAPTCHGGVLLLGFGYLWLVGAGLRRGTIGLLPVALFCVGFVGLLSDTLFLFQVVLPVNLALFLGRWRHPGFAPWWRWQGACGVAALLVAQLFKPICLAAGWFYFSRLLRVAPTPSHQWAALLRLLSDVPQLLRENWGFAVLLLTAAGAVFRAWRAAPTPSPDDPTSGAVHGGSLGFYRVFCVASLLIMLPLPILSCGWKDANNVRYLLNWLVLPGFLLTVEMAARWRVMRRWHLGGIAAVFLILLTSSALGLARESLRFPYPDDVATLDAILQRRGLKYGLAQYWNAKQLTALSHAGAELRQIRPDGTPFFWDNNVYAYYERDAADTLKWPAYRYIVTDQLDPVALARNFGEPQAKEIAGRYEVWIYGEEGQDRIRASLEPAVRAKLGPRHAPMP